MFRPFAIMVTLLISVTPSHAVVVSNVANGEALPGEPVYGLNHDGIGALRITIEDPFGDEEFLLAVCTASLISDRHILTAAHCFDIDEDGNPNDWFEEPFPASVTARFELPGEVLDIPISPVVHVPSDWRSRFADLAIAELTAPVPTDLARYPLYSGTRELGREMTFIGYGGLWHGSSGFPEAIPDGDEPMKAAARNRFEVPAEWLVGDLPGLIEDPASPDPPPGATLIFDFDSGSDENNSLAVWGFDSDVGLGDDEGGGGPGDSGGPLFIDGAIAGIFSFGLPAATGADATESWDGSWGEVFGSTRVSPLQEFIAEATGGAARFTTDGDFDLDNQLTEADIDRLAEAIKQQSTDSKFDLNRDGGLDAEDYQLWVIDIKQTWLGDSTLDGHFDSGDLVEVFKAGHYEDGIESNSTWATGDWNGDRDFDTGDLVSAFNDGGFEAGLRMPVVAVPEPSCMMPFALGLFGILSRLRVKADRTPGSTLGNER